MISGAGVTTINGPAVSVRASGPVVAVTVQAPVPSLTGSISSPEIGTIQLAFQVRPPISTGQPQLDALLARAAPTIYDAIFEGALPPGEYQVRLSAPVEPLPPVQFALSAIIPQGSAPAAPQSTRPHAEHPVEAVSSGLGALIDALNMVLDIPTTETAMVQDGSLWSWSCPFDVAVIRGIHLTGAAPGLIGATITAGSDRVPLVVLGRASSGNAVIWNADYHTVPTLLKGWTLSIQRPTGITGVKLTIAS